MKNILIVLLILFSFLVAAGTVSADIPVAQSSAKIKTNNINSYSDYRINTLKNYLESHNSPLASYAGSFVLCADKYDLDWRFVAAISGVESTFGKRIPFNSYNAYGWANGTYYFDSWDESIEIVSKALREKYINKGATTIDQIARIYAPPSSTWGSNVKFFMKKIDAVPMEFTL